VASPVAHSLAGAIIYLSARRDCNGGHQELWWLILAANLADFDLIPSLLMGDHGLFHRTFSHSISAAVVLAALVYAVCRWRQYHYPLRMTLLISLAYGSQLLVDWLSYDPGPVAGIPLLYPFSHVHYMADPTVFLNIERNDLFSAGVIIHNLKAVLLEFLLLGPLAAGLWLWRRVRRKSGATAPPGSGGC